MRLTSRSNSVRSKNRLRDHGRNPLSCVARIPFSSSALHGVRAAELDRRHLHVARFAARGRGHRDAAGSSQEVFASPSRRVARLLLSAALRLSRASAFRRLRARRGLLFCARLCRSRSIRSTTLPSGGGSADGRLRLLALDARLDQLHQILAVLVGVLRRIPLGREVVDEHFRHVELGLAHLFARPGIPAAPSRPARPHISASSAPAHCR